VLRLLLLVVENCSKKLKESGVDVDKELIDDDFDGNADGILSGTGSVKGTISSFSVEDKIVLELNSFSMDVFVMFESVPKLKLPVVLEEIIEGSVV